MQRYKREHEKCPVSETINKNTAFSNPCSK
uniref:Uncharacterized protein n=1 Tax=Anguilla anguilla TaxID=7936 RepID=A0A0E9TRG4_ANGAN